MKIRNGFVSNSSSSSFIVGFPKGLTRLEKIACILSKIGVEKGDFFFDAGLMVASCIVDSNKMTPKQVADDYGHNSWEEMVESCDCVWTKRIIDAVSRCQEKGFQMYSGSASNESYEPGETLFCDIGWEIDNEDFFIWKENGF